MAYTPEEATRTRAILEAAQTKKTKLILIIDSILYWVLLLLAILGNFIISVILVPYLLILHGPFLYFSIFFTGLSFGFIFTFLIKHIETGKDKKIIATILIPSIALISTTIIGTLSNKLIILLALTTPAHNPLLVGTAYVLGYILPNTLIKF